MGLPVSRFSSASPSAVAPLRIFSRALEPKSTFLCDMWPRLFTYGVRAAHQVPWRTLVIIPLALFAWAVAIYAIWQSCVDNQPET